MGIENVLVGLACVIASSPNDGLKEAVNQGLTDQESERLEELISTVECLPKSFEELVTVSESGQFIVDVKDLLDQPTISCKYKKADGVTPPTWRPELFRNDQPTVACARVGREEPSFACRQVQSDVEELVRDVESSLTEYANN